MEHDWLLYYQTNLDYDWLLYYQTTMEFPQKLEFSENILNSEFQGVFEEIIIIGVRLKTPFHWRTPWAPIFQFRFELNVCKARGAMRSQIRISSFGGKFDLIIICLTSCNARRNVWYFLKGLFPSGNFPMKEQRQLPKCTFSQVTISLNNLLQRTYVHKRTFVQIYE